MGTTDFTRVFQGVGVSVMGSEHWRSQIVNQDKHSLRFHPRAVVGVVCDGCSSSASSEIGADWCARAVQRILDPIVGRKPDQPVDLGENSEVWRTLQEELLKGMEAHAKQTEPADWKRYLRDAFLFTIVGFIITEQTTAVFIFGDGVFLLGEEGLKVIDHHNVPPYLVYRLINKQYVREHPDDHKFKVATKPTSEVDTLLVGSDGVVGLAKAEGKKVSWWGGRSIHLVPVDRLFDVDEFFNVQGEVEKYLRRVAGLWGLSKSPTGFLPDDTTLILIRRASRVGRGRVVIKVEIAEEREPAEPEESGAVSNLAIPPVSAVGVKELPKAERAEPVVEPAAVEEIFSTGGKIVQAAMVNGQLRWVLQEPSGRLVYLDRKLDLDYVEGQDELWITPKGVIIARGGYFWPERYGLSGRCGVEKSRLGHLLAVGETTHRWISASRLLKPELDVLNRIKFKDSPITPTNTLGVWISEWFGLILYRSFSKKGPHGALLFQTDEGSFYEVDGRLTVGDFVTAAEVYFGISVCWLITHTREGVHCILIDWSGCILANHFSGPGGILDSLSSAFALRNFLLVATPERFAKIEAADGGLAITREYPRLSPLVRDARWIFLSDDERTLYIVERKRICSVPME